MSVDRDHRPAADRDQPGTLLTPRQLEVARLVADALSSQQIADSLFISKRTVDTLINQAYRRTGTRNRVTLTVWLAQNDLLRDEKGTTDGD